MSKEVIAVDLDGTLIYADLTWELLLQSFIKSPFRVFYLLLKTYGRLNLLKDALVSEFGFSLQCDTLPYNTEVLTYLKQKKKEGHFLVLATASHHKQARKVADFLGLFDDVLASDQQVNLKADKKAEVLVQRFGARNFVYLGNSKDDLPVWRVAKTAICVNGSPNLFHKADCDDKVHFSKKGSLLHVLPKLLRVYQWVKNSLLFLPLIASHQIFKGALFWETLLGFLSFSLMASSLYVVNDLFDLVHDRSHPRKKKRPLAAGTVQIPQALMIFCGTFMMSLSLGACLHNVSFLGVLCLYGVTSLAYSVALKKLVLVDVLALAFLFVVRVFAGQRIADLALTHWFILFCGFTFFSLALVKRYAEFQNTRKESLSGRGYQQEDFALITNLGISSALISQVIFGLYISAPSTAVLYPNPFYLWFVIPLLTYVFSYIWLSAGRGKLDDDPILFIFKKRRMYLTGFLILVCFVAAKL